MGIKFIIQPWLNSLVDALWKNKSQIVKELDRSPVKRRLAVDSSDEEYLGIPTEVIEEFPHSDILPVLNELVPDLLESSRTKTSFARSLAEALTNSIVSVR